MVRRRRFPTFDLGGPPVVEVPSLSSFKIRSTSPEFARAFLAEAGVRQALEAARALHALRLGWCIEVTTQRFWMLDEAGQVNAVAQAWNVARAAAERLSAFV